MNLKIASKAMYGSWGFYSPTRTLFDVGEGVSSALGNYVYAIEDVFIGHSHSDHIAGLPSLIGARAYARGDKEKALTIHYPESDNMTLIKDYISKLHKKLPYTLNWVEVGPGFTKDFDNGMKLEAFYVKHAYNSIGFKILEKRTRLKAGINPADAKFLVSKGENITEEYWANIFTWTLDSAKYDLNHVKGCAWLVADTTFLSSVDRDDNTHASVEEVLAWAKESNIKRLTLGHFSVRYNWNEITPFVLDKAAKIGFNGKIDIVLPNKVYEF